MKIVILGAKGNLGSQLKLALEQDHEVYAFDRDDFNALDKEILSNVLTDLLPDLVVNTIAYNKVDNCENEEHYSQALALNRDLPAYLASLALKLDFILAHYSTDYVFSGLKNDPEFVEDDTPNPINKYGESKFLGELELLKLKDRGLKFYIVRTSKLFGPRLENSNAKPSFFDIMLKAASENNELKVVSEEQIGRASCRERV